MTPVITMKGSVLGIVVLVCLFLAGGCGKPGESDVIGSWTGTLTFDKGLKMPDVNYTLTFKEDKTFVFSNTAGTKDEGTWEFKDDVIVLTYNIAAEGMRPAMTTHQRIVFTPDGKGLAYQDADDPTKAHFTKAK